MLPEIDRGRVRAKSKADWLAKALAIFQTMWMVIQTIARRASGLPLLELSTLAHVLCTVIMYGAWWKKPQYVSDPIEVPIEPSVAAII